MAKNQTEHLKSYDKNQENHLPKAVSLTPQLDQDQLGLNSQMVHAVNSPDHASPGTIQLLQERYGNNEVRRIVQPGQASEPIVDQSRKLKKHISDEIQRARGGGQPLGSDIFSQATQKFGKNLDNVRLHTDRNSDQISRQIQAKAFTVGNDIFFRSGAYSPNSEQGRQTLMHELTHVVQQSSSSTSSGPLKLGEADDQYEREADTFARGESKSKQSGIALNKSVVQRLTMAGFKKKVGSVFNRSGSTGTSSSNPQQQSSVQQQAPTQVKPASPPPVPTTPPGLFPDEWELIQKAGVKDKDDWKTFFPSEKRAILEAVKSDFSIAQKLIEAEKAHNWPLDETGNKTYSLEIIKDILGKFGMEFSEWSTLKNDYRKLLLSFKNHAFVSTLAGLAKTDKWPKDGSNNDIADENVFKTITQTWKITLVQWNSITEADQREFLLKNSSKPYADELVRAAIRNLWPNDGSNKPILDDSSITKITDGMGINLWTWINVNSAGQRDFLLKAGGSLSKDYLKELAHSAKSGIWPKDGNGNDISSSNEWKKIKDAFPVMTPTNWNGLAVQVRKDALAESDITKRKNIINSANFEKGSKETNLEKAGGIASHPAFDLVAGTLGTTSGIIGASKGTGDNAGLDRASGIVGGTSDLLSIGTSTTQLLGSASKIGRGKKMANDPNSSLAMKALGRKEMSKGKWGVAQSTFGLAGSTASFGGNLTKSIDPESKGAKDTSSGFGVASGFLGMFGSALGLGKGSASMHSARKRSNLAKGFVKTAATGQTLSAEEQKMNEIAQFTAKNQNKTGKGFGIFKSVSSFLGSAVNTIGSIGSLAGLSNEAGLGLGITGAALSGIGVLGGIGQWAAESKGKPQEADVEAQAMKLIDLLRLGDPKGKEAAKFVQTVLKIDLVKVDDPDSWSNWIDEDEKAAVALIKSKLSKF